MTPDKTVSPAKLVNLRDLYRRASGHTYMPVATIAKFIQEYRIEIVAEFQFGAGRTRMVTQETADRVLAEYAANHRTETPVSAQEEPDAASLHLGAVETKLDRLCERQQAVEQAISLLLKQSNLLTDEIKKLTDQLR